MTDGGREGAGGRVQLCAVESPKERRRRRLTLGALSESAPLTQEHYTSRGHSLLMKGDHMFHESDTSRNTAYKHEIRSKSKYIIDPTGIQD